MEIVGGAEALRQDKHPGESAKIAQDLPEHRPGAAA
jgi:hypothetical protein